MRRAIRKLAIAGAALVLVTGAAVTGRERTARADTLPAHADTTLYVTWLDHASPSFTSVAVHVVNPGATTATGSVAIPGVWSAGFTVGPAGATYVGVPQGVIGGPAVVRSSAPVQASVRVRYNGSMSETAARSAAEATADAWFNWYDEASPGFAADNIHIVNPGTAAVTGTLAIPGHSDISFSVAPQSGSVYSFAGTIGGPVRLRSSAPVLASARTIYDGSFWETPAMAPSAAATDEWFNWYDQATPLMAIDNIHLVNPGDAAASGTVSIPNGPSQTFSVGAGQEWYTSFPGGIGGPVHVHVTSGPGVLASQRLVRRGAAFGEDYFDEFSEWSASGAQAAQTDTWFPWYDDGSPGFVDDVHIANPGADPSTVTVSAGGHSATLTVPAQGDVVQTFAGVVGGPLRITVTAGPPVIAVQRAMYTPRHRRWAPSTCRGTSSSTASPARRPRCA